VPSPTENGVALVDVQNAESDAPPKARQGLPFAARVQGILILVMVVGFVLIAQQTNKQLYKIGLPLLVVAAFLQIAFGNIPPSAGFVRSIKLLVLTWIIVAAVFALGIWLAPDLIDASRGG
jgi:hypothetical protein